MQDLSGKVYGLLVVEEMPFFALQEETLQTINLLLGYYTDSVAANDLVRPLLPAHPDCPAQFASELQRMEHVLCTSQLSSTALVLEFSASAVAAETPQLIMQMERNLDQSWLLSGAEKTVLAILMPLSSHAASEGFMNRLADHLKQRGIDSLTMLHSRHTSRFKKARHGVGINIVGFVHLPSLALVATCRRYAHGRLICLERCETRACWPFLSSCNASVLVRPQSLSIDP